MIVRLFRALVPAGVVLSLVAACSNDDDIATPTSTSAVDTTGASTPDAAATAPPADATPATSSTTTAPPTTAPSSTTTTTPPVPAAGELELVSFEVPPGSRPHDVAPAVDGGVWYTAQAAGALGWLDPDTGETRHVPLGAGSRPHGVIVGPDGAPWITDGGLDAIVTVDPATDEVTTFPLPAGRPNANLNTAAFAPDGRLFFTGQAGIYGVLDPATGAMEVRDAPGGTGPYGITATPSGDIYYASLAGSYVGRIEDDLSATVLEPPTSGQGARRVWSDSSGAIWVSEWEAGQLGRYDPATDEWAEWPLPGPAPQAYAVYVDELDQVWVSDFGGNAIHRFRPDAEVFDTFPLPGSPGNVRQILGRPGEVWAPESAADQLVVIRPA